MQQVCRWCPARGLYKVCRQLLAARLRARRCHNLRHRHASSPSSLPSFAELGETPYYAFEFFPPRTTEGVKNLYQRAERLAKQGEQ